MKTVFHSGGVEGFVRPFKPVTQKVRAEAGKTTDVSFVLKKKK
jgi:hypothetical protein